MIKNLVTIGAVLGLSGSAVVQAEAAPKPIEDLKCLVGSWTGTGHFEAGKDKAAVGVRYECRESAGGAGVACRGEMTGVPGLAKYEWDDLWGFDPGDGSVHWFTVTNAGETHDHGGKIVGRNFEGTFQGVREGQPMIERVKFAFKNKRRVAVTSQVEVGGQKAELVDVVLEKRDGASR